MEHTTETLLLQKRAGIITEAQYKEKMQSLKEIMKPTDDELTTIAKYYMSRNSYGKYNKAIADIKYHISRLDYDLPMEREAIEAYGLVLNKVKELSNAAMGKGKLSDSERVEDLDSTLENKYKEFIEHLHIARK